MDVFAAQAFLFDMDGVIVKNCHFHVLSWLAFAERHGGHVTEEQIVAWMGAPGRDYIARMFDRPMSDDEIDRLLKEKEALYREMYRPQMTATAGVRAFLSRAQEKGIPCVVATGGSLDNVNFVMDGLDLRRFFAGFVDASQYDRGKPAPDCYLQAAAKVGADLANCIVFEDALNGIEAARAAGMHVVGFTGTNTRACLAAAKPDLVVDTFKELLPA